MSVILVAGGLIFSSEINGLFPTTAGSIVESLKNDVSNMGVNTADSIKERLDTSVNKAEKQIDESLNKAEKQIDESLNKATESSKEFISDTVNDVNPIDQIGGILKNGISSEFPSGGSGSQQSTTNYDYSANKQSTEPTEFSSPNQINNDQNLVYETLSLSTIQQSDENILLQYQDSSGKTESVTVTIRNSEKEIFSGTFFSSMFETTVNEASNIPYQIDMIVEHQEYGIVSSSVLNPGDSSDSKINGIFTQS